VQRSTLTFIRSSLDRICSVNDFGVLLIPKHKFGFFITSTLNKSNIDNNDIPSLRWYPVSFTPTESRCFRKCD